MLTHKATQTIQTARLILRRAVREDAAPMFRNWVSVCNAAAYSVMPSFFNLARIAPTLRFNAMAISLIGTFL